MENADAVHEIMQSPRPRALREGKRPGTGSDVIALLVLATGSLAVGVAINALRAKPLPWVYRSRVQAMETAVAQVADSASTPVANGDPAELPHEIRLEEFQDFVAAHKGLVLDARPAVFYRESHVPGALSLPRETFAEDYPRLRGTLESSKNRPIAIYCSGADCPDSQLLTDALTKLGYRHLLIYTSGWDEWSQTGLPQEGASLQP